MYGRHLFTRMGMSVAVPEYPRRAIYQFIWDKDIFSPWFWGLVRLRAWG